MTVQKTSGVCIISHLDSEKVYIGSAINLHKRLREHIYILRNNKHSNYV